MIIRKSFSDIKLNIILFFSNLIICETHISKLRLTEINDLIKLGWISALG